MIDLLIIIPTLKLSKLLENCLNSLQKSRFSGEFSVAVSLNAQNPPEFNIWKKKYPEILWFVNNKNLGFAGAINAVLRQNKSRHFFLLNDDTLVFPDTLQNVVIALEKGKVAVVGAKIYYPDGKTLQHCGGILKKNFISIHLGNYEMDEGQYDNLLEYDYVTGAAMGINGEYLEKYGLLSERYFPGFYEETEYCLKAKQRGYRVIYDPAVQIIHHESQSFQRFSNFYFFHYHKNRGIYILRNAGMAQILQAIKEELRWIWKSRPSEHYYSLVRAYLYLLITFPYYLFTRKK